MNKIADIMTAGVSRASDILFVQNPKGTSLGAFFGIAVDGLLKLFTPTFGKLREWIETDRVNAFHLIALGIFAFNIKHLFRRRQLPNSIENAIEAIKIMEREGASPLQVKMRYIALCDTIVAKAMLDQARAKRIDRRQEF